MTLGHFSGSLCHKQVAPKIAQRNTLLELRISNPTLEISLILGETGQWFRACGGEGLMAGKAGCLKQLNVSLDTTS